MLPDSVRSGVVAVWSRAVRFAGARGCVSAPMAPSEAVRLRVRSGPALLVSFPVPENLPSRLKPSGCALALFEKGVPT